jgi:hypothetical protein
MRFAFVAILYKGLGMYNDFEIAASASNVDNISNEFSDLNRKLF